MKKDRTGIIFLIIALVGFVLIKVVPLVYSPSPSHETGRIEVNKTSIDNDSQGFVKQGNGWFKSSDKQTLVVLDIELANTPEKISAGLKNRKKMEQNQGMLFVFNEMDSKSFWMKNTTIPLDIVYIRKNGTIDSYYKNTTPFSIKLLPSNGQVLYVLEVNAGFMDKHGITKTARFDFNKQEKVKYEK